MLRFALHGRGSLARKGEALARMSNTAGYIPREPALRRDVAAETKALEVKWADERWAGIVRQKAGARGPKKNILPQRFLEAAFSARVRIRPRRRARPAAGTPGDLRLTRFSIGRTRLATSSRCAAPSRRTSPPTSWP
mmetsp:Transcript_22092/g.76544  ORF Transcript_22092/g.76544 Transcript_22092/m.76544 type:complete len:137 (+) Transcript_22092:316-726(+)